MAITSGEIKIIESATVSDAGGNGGRMGTAEVGSSYFPDVTGSQRAAGLTRHRKEFFKQINRDSITGVVNLTLYAARAFLKKITPADDYFRIAVEDTVGDIQTDAENVTKYPAVEWAGVGTLDTDETGGATSIDVVAEVVDASSNGGFDPSCTIRISDGTSTEFVVLTADSVTFSGGKATLNLDTPLVNSYNRASHTHTDATYFSATTIGHSGATFGGSQELAGDLVRITGGTGAGQTRRITSHTGTLLTVAYPWITTPDATSDFEVIATYVSKVIDCGDIVAKWTDNSDVENQFTDANGLYDEVGSPLNVFPIGCIEQTWTLTIEALAATFSVEGDTLGIIATGLPIGATYKPDNGTSSYFELLGAGWGGSPAEGNTIIFKTKPSAKGIWIRQVVPATSNAHGDVRCLLGLGGDTV